MEESEGENVKINFFVSSNRINAIKQEIYLHKIRVNTFFFKIAEKVIYIVCGTFQLSVAKKPDQNITVVNSEMVFFCLLDIFGLTAIRNPALQLFVYAMYCTKAKGTNKRSLILWKRSENFREVDKRNIVFSFF